MADIDVRRRLPRDLFWLVGLLALALGVKFGLESGFGTDSHAYWMAWRDEMFDRPPGTRDAYLYSPSFAQVIWPLVQLPWPLFAALWFLAGVATLLWLVRGVDWYVAIPLLALATQDLVSGNINWLLAAVVAYGLRYPSLWSFALLTKITVAVGFIWFLVRGEWRQLLRCSAVATGVVAVSFAISPTEWVAWFSFLLEHVTASREPIGSPGEPAFIHRLPIAILLVAWGARTNRTWVLPVGLVLAAPVGMLAALAVLVAIPRLNAAACREPEGAGKESTVRDTINP